MKLEDQVVSFDLAKRLREVGVKQKSYYAWHDSELAGLQLIIVKNESDLAQKYAELVAAFSVAELGEMIPIKTMVEGKEEFIEFDRFGKHWLYYWGNPDDKPFSENEADARAHVLIDLIENGLVKP